MKVEVKLIDYWGEAFYTVFADGVEMTAEYNDMLPCKYGEDAEEVAKFIKEDLEDEQRLNAVSDLEAQERAFSSDEA